MTKNTVYWVEDHSRRPVVGVDHLYFIVYVFKTVSRSDWRAYSYDTSNYVVVESAMKGLGFGFGKYSSDQM